ncbi:hypothetical protein [Methanosphaera sp. WGK6]|uniref:hypothetical protein n=1 Tax=Methanosphaera sp. WGK6 TaxID=1561964 RepID=UPI0011811D40|nr:hypothetical protein [Methanosphaera sp. WGK6]
MSSQDNNLNDKESEEVPLKNEDLDVDPLDELNTIVDIEEEGTNTIEIIESEKDPLDILEQHNIENIPEYDSELGSIIETPDIDESEIESVEDSENNYLIEPTTKIEKIIEEVDINNKDNLKENKSKEVSQKNSSQDIKQETKKIVEVENKTLSKEKDSTKIIDNVKVDEDGVPLLNQFNGDKLKNLTFLSRFNFDMKKVIMMIIGTIIVIIGVIQILDDVIKLSDNVVYGEQKSMAIGLILFGIVVILLAFYKELLKLLGMDNIDSLNDIDSQSSMPKPKTSRNKNNKK